MNKSKSGEIPDVFPPDPPRRGRRRFKVSPLTALAFALVAIVVAMAATGRLGAINIQPDQVAVKVNYLSGSQETITDAGYQFYLPLIHDVYVLDKRVQNFEMVGDRFRESGIVPELTVRANDGSNFKFARIELQYQIVPGKAADVLSSSGTGDGYKLE